MNHAKRTEVLGWVMLLGGVVMALIGAEFVAGSLLFASVYLIWSAKHEELHEKLDEIKERLPK